MATLLEQLLDHPRQHEGHITTTEFVDFLQHCEIELDSTDLKNVVTSLDKNHDGEIDYSEIHNVLGSVATKEDLVKKCKLLSLFDKLDEDLSGEISMLEWQHVFLRMKYDRKEFCLSHNIDESIVSCVDDVSDKDVELLFKSMDNDNSGTIEFNEFYKLFEHSDSMKDIVKIAKLKVIFNRIDNDLNGSLDLNEVAIIFENEGIKLTRSQIEQLIEMIDDNHDGSVDFEEFRSAFEHVDNLKTLINEWKDMLVVDIGNDLSYSQYIQSSKDENYKLKFIAGGVGGISSRTATAPLERIKIMSQMGLYTSMKSIYNSIIETQGYRGLWKGNGVNCLRVFPFAGFVTFTYNYSLDMMLYFDPNVDTRADMSDGQRFIAGAIAGTVATTATYPLDVIRTHLSISMTQDSQQSKKLFYENILKWNVLFRGLAPTLVATSTMVGIQNMTYDKCSDIATQYLDIEPSVQLFMACGAIAGLTAQGALYPLDTIRRHIQMYGKSTLNTKYNIVNSMVPDICKKAYFIIKSQGVHTLYNGLTATYLKTVPSIAIAMSIRDTILGKHHKKD